MKTLIIAEAGVNHNGDIAMACELVNAAAEAGADIVKFQTFKAERLVTPCAEKANYQLSSVDLECSQYSMLKKLELTEEMHDILVEHCKKRGIKFLSTGFDIGCVSYLAELGQEQFKIPSGEITNVPYLRHIGQFKKPVILSTGMATLGEIEFALNVLEQSGIPLSSLTVLHCNTDYPTTMSDVNLRAMIGIRDIFGVRVGYSDHTLGIEVPIAAVALGASVIEKHLTLDCCLPGPDHKASIEPHTFKEMVVAIRNIEAALGGTRKNPSCSELKNKNAVRKSLVAAAPIKEGETFTVSNLTVKRPGCGISPTYWDSFIGRKSQRNYEINELIEF